MFLDDYFNLIEVLEEFHTPSLPGVRIKQGSICLLIPTADLFLVCTKRSQWVQPIKIRDESHSFFLDTSIVYGFKFKKLYKRMDSSDWYVDPNV